MPFAAPFEIEMSSESDSTNNTANPFVDIEIRVRYAETDQMKVAHHANYLVWFELARSEFCRSRGIDYGEMERQGYFLPVLDVNCRYRIPARYDDLRTGRAEVLELKRRPLRIRYTVRRGETQLAAGGTLQMLIGADGKPKAFPADIAARFEDLNS